MNMLHVTTGPMNVQGKTLGGQFRRARRRATVFIGRLRLREWVAIGVLLAGASVVVTAYMISGNSSQALAEVPALQQTQPAETVKPVATTAAAVPSAEEMGWVQRIVGALITGHEQTQKGLNEVRKATSANTMEINSVKEVLHKEDPERVKLLQADYERLKKAMEIPLVPLVSPSNPEKRADKPTS